MRQSSGGGFPALPLHLVAAIFCILWSSAFAVSKLGLADCPPLLFLAARLLLAGTIILLAALISGSLRLGRRDLLVLAVIGVANNALYLSLSYIGMQTVSAGLAALIGSANPVLTALLATTLLGEPMTWRKAAGLALGVGGVAFVVESRVSGGVDSAVGVACIGAGVMSLVTGTILLRRFALPGRLWVGNGVQNFAGGLAVLPFALAFEPLAGVNPSWRLLGALLFLALIVSVIGYFLWYYLIMTAGAAAASAYHFVMPPLGFLFGWLLLDEHVVARDMLGVVPIVIGIYLITRDARRAAAPRPVPDQAASPGISVSSRSVSRM